MTAAVGSPDPTVTDPDRYRVIFENERVRVLECTDRPGDGTHARTPDSVVYALSSFRRRLHHGDQQREVEIASGFVGWVPARRHRARTSGRRPATRSSSSSRRATPLRVTGAWVRTDASPARVVLRALPALATARRVRLQPWTS